ncbi:galactokinase [Actinocorallia sp. A-T 12471]|uniref:galactokinase n=1 Tax=Actinocorallia sp. A-T 12471 TaxID=3089813 RepID=UPI0029D32EF5|nr:galactokinase [Actinocorallia sp. A-T 12471]MDX6744495.1 galactokinase [Actinocorallia sp. A-T 12471]
MSVEHGVWHAPGRVNLIGEHTDYNDGLVLPFALPQGITAEAARRDDGVLELHSGGQTEIVPLEGLRPGSVKGWAAYVAGVAGALGEAGHPVGGATLRFTSDLPAGSGLSSSAALECVTAVALNDMYDLGLSAKELVPVAQRAENAYAGVPTGVLDQSASLLCTAEHALLLDVRSGLSSQIPLELGGFRILIVDTNARHALGDGKYGERRAQCEEAARQLGVASLRDVKNLGEALSRLKDPVLRRRVKHVVTENHRVEATVGLLKAGAIAEVGALLNASHLSLRDDYEVSWPEADAAVEAAVRAGARGGRMVGGGFGGSVIILARADTLDTIREAITTRFTTSSWPTPDYLIATAAPGAHRLS